MGAKVTVEEMRGYSDAKINSLEDKIINELKPEVKAVYDERKAAMANNAPATGGQSEAQATS